ncbi:MAG: aminotransferase class III-fold pyridoxal phosphate-dependent enzyme, partial [Oscillospiraceae bacterium]|nr:aminotransferase class III-fold pyridoxal phosphate-dependent enzyme [Oscillospiraceae bacterium]
VAQLCAEQDILLIVDEVQTGIGRTGSLFCYQQFDIQPDLVSMAKGLGGGLPIGGVMFGEKTHGVLTPGTHATTFGGNPVVCAGGCQIIKTITEPGFLDEVTAKGQYIRDALAVMPGVEGVDGMGLMLGVRLQEGIAAGDVVAAARAEGVLLLTAKTKVRMLPPLNISYDEIDRGLAAMGRAIQQLLQN